MNDGVFEDKSRLESILQTIPLHRIARPEELATPIVFLCSNWASYITGEPRCRQRAQVDDGFAQPPILDALLSRITYVGANIGAEFVGNKYADYYFSVSPADSPARRAASYLPSTPTAD